MCLRVLGARRESPRNAHLDRGVDDAMTTWGFIGSGNIGTTVARLAVNAGHDVVLSNSRGPETLADLVAQLGPHASAATPAEAARAGDVVVVTIPLRSYPQVPAEELRGKVVLDTMNYYPERDGHIAELDDESTTSSELLQAHVPEAKVVKAFNNIFFQHLAACPGPAAPRTAAPSRSRAMTRRRSRSSGSSSTRSATTPSTSAPSRRGGARSPTRRHTATCTPWTRRPGTRVPALPGCRGHGAGRGVASAPGRPGLTPAVGSAVGLVWGGNGEQCGSGR